MSDRFDTIADAVDALTNPIRVREPYTLWVNRNRVTRHYEHTLPCLLDQLAAAKMPGEVYTEDKAGNVVRAPRSVPPARLEAINACIQIDAGAARWTVHLNIPLRPTTAGNMRSLVGARTDSDIAKQLLSDARRWYNLAATLSGWERVWKPQAPCPACDETGHLRINLTRQTAVCVEHDDGGCGQSWDKEAIGILAAHIERTSSRPHWDTAHIRTAMTLARQAEERLRYQHETLRPTVLAGVIDQPNG
jgi:hypothetical protein